jgi:hypothetical protein
MTMLQSKDGLKCDFKVSFIPDALNDKKNVLLLMPKKPEQA